MGHTTFSSHNGVMDSTRDLEGIKARQKLLMSPDNLKNHGFYSREDFAAALGAGISAVRQYGTGRTVVPDALKQKFCELLGISLEYLLTGERQPMVANQPQRIPVIGEVQAGVWREALEFDEGEKYSLAIWGDGMERCYALRVAGDSMDKVYPEGHYVIVCPLPDYPRGLATGDRVIVKRQRDGIVEATIKELVVKASGAELWPRSSNIRYQSPISIHWPYDDPQKAANELVEIAGVVVASQNIEKKL
jgi:repressor LexA